MDMLIAVWSLLSFLGDASPSVDGIDLGTISSLGGTGALGFATFYLGKLSSGVNRFLERVEEQFDAEAKHRERELEAWRRAEEHQRRLEELIGEAAPVPKLRLRGRV